jgi:murein DD-endopeptidase MepM/ murein hydrolase activator NlpD
MGTEGTRARSHAHGKRHGRITVHLLVIALAVLAVTFAARYPTTSGASIRTSPPSFTFSGLSGDTASLQATYFHPGASNATRDSVLAIAIRSDVASVRASSGVSPTSSFSAGVSAAAAASGTQGAGVIPLADVVDPKQPYVIYVVQPGDSVSAIAERFGVKLETVLDNNPTIDQNGLIQLGQEVVVPRRDGIMHKVNHGETIDAIVAQYDNITSAQVIDYKPNGVTDANSLEAGKTLLLIGATRKPPPPPPEPEPSLPSGGGDGGSSSPLPGGSGRFGYPLADWHGVSDGFGSGRGAGRIHEGIDLDLYGRGPVNIFSACNGVVSRVEYLTYSYGYHVIVDCGDGWTTLYAHMSDIHVSPGQAVSQGTVLGLSGVTGYTTGHHLHFEIRHFGGPVNPAIYLGF